MQTLKLNAAQLPASKFPEPADAYLCDNCGRDITPHLYRGRAHVQEPLGPSRYECVCGQKYLTGTVEWDELDDWDKKRRLFDIFGLGPVGCAVVAGFGLLVYLAVHRHSPLLLALSALALVPTFVVALLWWWIAFAGAAEVVASLWRTKGRSLLHR